MVSRGEVASAVPGVRPLFRIRDIISFGLHRISIPIKVPFLSNAYDSGPPDSSEGGTQTTSHEHLNVGGGGRRIDPKFQVLTVATVLCTFGLITLGGVVRLTGSGLGCPDWPLCHGQIIPPLEYHALIEYSHRMLAVVVGMLIVLQMLIVWLLYRNRPWLLIPSALGVVLVIVQGALGGASVITELAGGLVLAHLATAEALVACLVVVSAVAIGPSPRLDRIRFAGSPVAELLRLTLITAAAGYVLLITGSYVTVSDAAISCGESWPLCNGRLFPESHLAWVHMTHRVMSVLVGALAVGVLASAFRLSGAGSPVRWAALAVGASVVVQVGLGATIVAEGFTAVVRVSHLSAGTFMWISLVVLTFMALKGQPDHLEGKGRA